MVHVRAVSPHLNTGLKIPKGNVLETALLPTNHGHTKNGCPLLPEKQAVYASLANADTGKIETTCQKTIFLPW